MGAGEADEGHSLRAVVVVEVVGAYDVDESCDSGVFGEGESEFEVADADEKLDVFDDAIFVTILCHPNVDFNITGDLLPPTDHNTIKLMERPQSQVPEASFWQDLNDKVAEIGVRTRTQQRRAASSHQHFPRRWSRLHLDN